MRILLVEDDYASRLMMGKYLEPFGEIDIAKEGSSAVHLFREAVDQGRQYQLVLLDIMLPELDGQEVLREFRSIEKEYGIKPVNMVKVIMTTALGDPKNVVRAFNEGRADSYLVKPIEKRKLLEEIEKLGFQVGT
jgi:two-component system chemotaxis response regulator CheY